MRDNGYKIGFTPVSVGDLERARQTEWDVDTDFPIAPPE